MSKKLIFFLIILLNVYFVYSVIDVPSNVVISGCGDGICSGNETCNNCKIDCGECFIPGSSVGGGGGGGDGGGRSWTPEKPKEIETPTCNEYWICDNWGNCINNEQNRVCYDLEKCNTTLYKPEEKKECGQEVAFPDLPKVEESNLFLIFILILILTIYLLTRKKKKRRKR